ncbi:MAG: DNA polymerase III subunit delta [Ignavibacteriales bacterium]|nr:DNA polymerase III subunit delta [Ignavibacteriales bacterium]
MAKKKVEVPSIYTIGKFLKKETLLPIYCFYGDDTFSIENAVKAVEKVVDPFLTSDFDKEIINAEERTVVEVIDLALAFPFGSEKKLIILKDFDELKGDKKQFAPYVKNPSASTVMLITKYGNIANLEAEPFAALLDKNFLFEANELKGKDLSSWIVKFAAKNGKIISTENAELLIDTVGDNRTLIEMQLQKIFTYLGDNKEIRLDVIKSVASQLKEYIIFDLLNAVGSRNKSKAVEVLFNLLAQGDEDKQALFILAMLNKYFTSIAQIPELEKDNITEQAKARIIGTHPYYYKEYVKASNFYKEPKILKISRALLNADVTMKTTSTDTKTVMLMLLAEIFQ